MKVNSQILQKNSIVHLKKKYDKMYYVHVPNNLITHCYHFNSLVLVEMAILYYLYYYSNWIICDSIFAFKFLSHLHVLSTLTRQTLTKQMLYK